MRWNGKAFRGFYMSVLTLPANVGVLVLRDRHLSVDGSVQLIKAFSYNHINGTEEINLFAELILKIVSSHMGSSRSAPCSSWSSPTA